MTIVSLRLRSTRRPLSIAGTSCSFIDDGPYRFQLRGVSPRGIANRVDPPVGAPAAHLAWYAVDTRRVLAWDHGAVREA